MNSRTWTVMGVIALLLTSIGCGATPSADDTADAGSTADRPVESSSATVDEPDVVVPAGTVVAIAFDDEISTDSSAPGDGFSATVSEPLYIDQNLAIDRGSKVRGRVVEVVRGKKIGGKAKLTLEFTAIELADGQQKPIDATFYSEGKSQAGKDAATIGGSTAGGAILGRIIGHQSDEDDKGTAIGAVVGAAIGTAIAASNDGQPVTIPAGATMAIRLDSPVTIEA